MAPILDGEGPSAGARPYAFDPERAKALWANSEELVGERFWLATDRAAGATRAPAFHWCRTADAAVDRAGNRRATSGGALPEVGRERFH